MFLQRSILISLLIMGDILPSSADLCDWYYHPNIEKCVHGSEAVGYAFPNMEACCIQQFGEEGSCKWHDECLPTMDDTTTDSSASEDSDNVSSVSSALAATAVAATYKTGTYRNNINWRTKSGVSNGAKAAKVAKSSKSKSGKSCPTKIVADGFQLRTNQPLQPLPVDIPDEPSSVSTTIPVTLEDGCNCTVANVAIDIGINHPNVGDLIMQLNSPDNLDVVLLVNQPPSGANLVPDELITFNDNAIGVALNPSLVGSDVDGSGNTQAGTYYAQGTNPSTLDPSKVSYPSAGGLVKFNGDPAAGDWFFRVIDVRSGNAGTIQSVELTITCAV